MSDSDNEMKSDLDLDSAKNTYNSNALVMLPIPDVKANDN